MKSKKKDKVKEKEKKLKINKQIVKDLDAGSQANKAKGGMHTIRNCY